MSEPATGTKAKLADVSISKRLGIAAMFVIVVGFPAIVVGLLGYPQAVAMVFFGAIVGVGTVLSEGRSLGLSAVALFVLVSPIAVLAGLNPVAGAALVALLCLGSGVSSLWGLHNSLVLIPMISAYLVIDPPSVNASPPDRTSTAYLLVLMGLLALGGLWNVIIIPLLIKALAHRSIHLSIKQNDLASAIWYTVVTTILCSASTLVVLAWLPEAHGAWLVMTLLVIVKIGPGQTTRMTVERVVGTVFGALIAAGLGAAISNTAVITLITMVMLIIAIVEKLGPRYWLYVTLLTPTVILLTSGGDLYGVDAQRVLFTLAAALLVVVASGLAIGYQHLVSKGRLPSRSILHDRPHDLAVRDVPTG